MPGEFSGNLELYLVKISNNVFAKIILIGLD